VWVLISSLLPFIREDISIAAEHVAIVTAVPVVLGSVLRIPLGYYANVIGARLIFLLSFIVLLFPVYYISIASSMLDLIIAGTFLGIGGAIFSVGVTSLPKYYPKEKHGLINGIYGMGNAGTAVTTFAAPVLAAKFGWTTTVQFYLVLLLAFALLNFFLGDRKEEKEKTKIVEQIKGVYKNEKLWLFSLFYFVTFGSFVAFTVFLPSFLVDFYALVKVVSGIKIGAIILAYTLAIYMYTVGSLLIEAVAGIGIWLIFKLVPYYFQKQAGTANGIVSMMGGLGGFFPPLLLSAIFSITGSYSIGFMAFSQFALVSLLLVLWMYYMDQIGRAHV